MPGTIWPRGAVSNRASPARAESIAGSAEFNSARVATARNSVNAYLHSVSLVREPLRHQLFSAELRRELGGYRVAEVFQRHAARAALRPDTKPSR